VIVDDLDVVRVSTLPTKTDSPLVIDSNAVLSLATTHELFKPIRWRDPEIIERSHGIQDQ
jgi:hypothetical protein